MHSFHGFKRVFHVRVTWLSYVHPVIVGHFVLAGDYIVSRCPALCSEHINDHYRVLGDSSDEETGKETLHIRRTV